MLFLVAGAPRGVLAAWPSARADGWAVSLRRGASRGCARWPPPPASAPARRKLRTGRLIAPAFEAAATPVLVEGWVLANDASETGPRLRLLVRAIEGVERAAALCARRRSATLAC